MIVVDSSVWIEHLRGRPSAEVSELARPIRADEDLLVGDLVLCEVLQGVPSDTEAELLESQLREFGVVRMVDDEVAVEAAGY